MVETGADEKKKFVNNNNNSIKSKVRSKNKGSGENQKKKKKESELDHIKALLSDTMKPFDSSQFSQFKELPISQKTLDALEESKFQEMTEIQKSSFGNSLCGSDILGAAKTGSGKTLAFVIPVIEKLYREKWGLMDGLGAVIISPTRELALQIFGVLRKVGRNHQLSAGLIIGGKDYEFERERVNRMNILVCTPGRLLQHMDSTPLFDASQLQILVLDEADRILDMGFRKTVDAILEHLPVDRQTLLFSATQTKSVGDLARLSLRNPEYVAVHEKSDRSTPDALIQNYLVCDLPQKLDILFSFLRTHLKSKIIIFLSSCKQVRFVYDTFCKMQPGIVLMCLHGKQRQDKRSLMFEKFCRSQHAAMFCTDIAARGLDFPRVDWVIQVDCPDDGDTYIHRVGRTARFNSNGRALLFLLPSEEQGMLEVFERKRIPIEKLAVNPKHSVSVSRELQAFCAQQPELKYLGEKALICYLRSIWLNANKKVFDVTQLPIEDYASSLGLPGVPQLKFIRRLKDEKNKIKAAAAGQHGQHVSFATGDDSEYEDDGRGKDKPPVTRVDKMFAKRNQSVLWGHYSKIKTGHDDSEERNGSDSDEEEDVDFLKLTRRDHELDINQLPTCAPTFHERPLSVRDKRNMKIKSRTMREADHLSGTKIEFDDDGTPHLSWKLETEAEFNNQGDTTSASGGIVEKHQKYIYALKDALKEADVEDKQAHKMRLREKKLKEKMKERRKNQRYSDDEGVVTVGRPLEEEDSVQSEDDTPKKRLRLNETTIEDQEALALTLLNGK
jgi:ATP-dependent RNA helicase DDX10/DBP4